ncbi:MAG: hypothetical protein EOP49_37305, partial [Sphingobacteriales bacterium]
MIESAFRSALSGFAISPASIDALWSEIDEHYSKPGRHYHNLQHLQNVLDELEAVKKEIADWSLLILSVAYHDIIYNPLKQNNEEKSGVLAVKRLREAGLAPESADIVNNHILATKGHRISDCPDTNFLTDADLSILGSAPGIYNLYSKQIRKEYQLYPDLIYNPGRQKVVRYFL